MILYIARLLANGHSFCTNIFSSCCTTSRMSYVPTLPCTSIRTSCSCPSSPLPAEGACARFLCTSRPLSVLRVNISSATVMPCMLITSFAPDPQRCLRTGWCLLYWVSQIQTYSVRVQLYYCYCYCIINAVGCQSWSFYCLYLPCMSHCSCTISLCVAVQ